MRIWCASMRISKNRRMANPNLDSLCCLNGRRLQVWWTWWGEVWRTRPCGNVEDSAFLSLSVQVQAEDSSVYKFKLRSQPSSILLWRLKINCSTRIFLLQTRFLDKLLWLQLSQRGTWRRTVDYLLQLQGFYRLPSCQSQLLIPFLPRIRILFMPKNSGLVAWGWQSFLL